MELENSKLLEHTAKTIKQIELNSESTLLENCEICGRSGFYIRCPTNKMTKYPYIAKLYEYNTSEGNVLLLCMECIRVGDDEHEY